MTHGPERLRTAQLNAVRDVAGKQVVYSSYRGGGDDDEYEYEYDDGSTEDDRCCSHIVSAPCPPPPDIDPLALPADAQTEDQKELKLFRRRAPDCHCIGAVLNQLSWSWRECVDNRQVAVCQLELHKLSSSEVRGFSMNEL